MSVEITTYAPDGRMLCPMLIYEVSDSMTAPYGLYVYGRYDPDVMMVNDEGRVAERPPNLTNVVGTTLFNIPLPARIRIDDGRGVRYYDVTDSTVELDFPIPGHYNVEVRCFPQKNAMFGFDIR